MLLSFQQMIDGAILNNIICILVDAMVCFGDLN
jgi:hypothetical protein